MVCHKLSHFNSRVFTLGFTWNCRRLLEARTFLRNPGQIKWITRETRYHVSIGEILKLNHMSQVSEWFWRPKTMLKILYFSGDNQFLPKLPGIMFLYDWVKRIFIYCPGRHFLRPGRQFQQNNSNTLNADVKLNVKSLWCFILIISVMLILTGEAAEGHLTGTLGQSVQEVW